jgi:opacity protein-like surface antigen
MMTLSVIKKQLAVTTILMCTAISHISHAAHAPVLSKSKPWYVSLLAGASLTNNYETSITFDLNSTTHTTNLLIDHKPGFHVGCALGFRYNDKWRIEGQYSYFHTQTSKVIGSPVTIPPPPVIISPPIVTPVPTGDATLNTQTLMVNVLYDFYQISDQIEPYMGAGIGAAWLHSKAKANVPKNEDPNDPDGVFNPAVDLLATQRDSQLAVQGLLGFRYNVANTTFVDFGYRFLSITKPSFYRTRVQENRFTLTYTYQINPK